MNIKDFSDSFLLGLQDLLLCLNEHVVVHLQFAVDKCPTEFAIKCVITVLLAVFVLKISQYYRTYFQWSVFSDYFTFLSTTSTKFSFLFLHVILGMSVNLYYLSEVRREIPSFIEALPLMSLKASEASVLLLLLLSLSASHSRLCSVL